MTTIVRKAAHRSARSIGLLLSLLCTTSCDRPSEDASLAISTASIGKTRGYILISIDTLRADHLGTYGYTRDTSPFLDSLAERGVLFENAVAHIPSTLPSHVSMLTGLHPKEHRVYPPDGVIPESIETLAEIFRRSGYRTAGFTGGGYMSKGFGFDRGFEVFGDRIEAEKLNRRIENIFGQGLDFIGSLADDEEYFLFLHTYAVHDPYDPPEPYRNRFWSGPKPVAVWEPTGPNISNFNCGHEALTPRERDYLVALYDAGIRYADDVLADFFAGLEEYGVAEDVTVIITSDHGEEFLEHSLLGHAQVFHHNLHVPLLVLHPQLEPTRIHSLARLVDVTPTLTDLANLTTPGPVTGTSLRAALVAETTEPTSMSSYAQASVGGGEAIYRVNAEGGALLQYVRHDRATSWITPRGLAFDSTEPILRVAIRAFLQPRKLRIEIDGKPHNEFLIEPVIAKDRTDPAQIIEIPLPQDGQKHRVRLIGDDCAPASAIGARSDCRCFSFQVPGVPTRRDAFYEVINDPLEAFDLSSGDPAETALLSVSLDEANHQFEAVAESETHELDPAVVERLKALGYL